MWDGASGDLQMDASCAGLHFIPREDVAREGLGAWLRWVVPGDQAPLEMALRLAAATGAGFHHEYDVVGPDGIRRVRAHASPCGGQRLLGMATRVREREDDHDLKLAQTERDLIAQELGHRIKNLFAVVSSLISLCARSQPEARPFAATLQARLGALATANEFVRRHRSDSGPPIGTHNIHDLLATLTAAYQPRISVLGEDVEIGPHAATSVALIVHELCTNAVKYGALSKDGGSVTLRTERSQDAYRLTWQEQGGPLVEATPSHRGFGTTLSERVVSVRLKAEVLQDWRPEGLVFTITIPIERLAQ
jgi:two-component sensor histidine kinase